MKKTIYLILAVALVIAVVVGAIWDFTDTILYLIPAIIPVILLSLAFVKYKKRKNDMSEEEKQIFKTANEKFKVFNNFATCFIVASIVVLLCCIIFFDIAAYNKTFPKPVDLNETRISSIMPLNDEVGVICNTCYTLILLVLFIVYYVFIISVKNKKGLTQAEKDVLLKCYKGMGIYIIISLIASFFVSTVITFVISPISSSYGYGSPLL